MIYGIVAKNQDGYIGTLDNKLPWRIPEDLKFFKEVTTGHKVVMGRKTYESIGKPLTNRENVVISRNTQLEIEGVTVINSINECVANEVSEDIFIIGGAEIYKAFENYINAFYVTEVDFEMGEGVKIDLSKFRCIIEGAWQTSETGIKYRFCKYCRF